MTQPIGSLPSKLVPQAATRCVPINVLSPCQNIHSIPRLYMHHKCSRENGGAAPSCLKHPAAVCLFAVRGAVASYSPPGLVWNTTKSPVVSGYELTATVLTQLSLSRRRVHPADCAPATGVSWEATTPVHSRVTLRISTGEQLNRGGPTFRPQQCTTANMAEKLGVKRLCWWMRLGRGI